MVNVAREEEKKKLAQSINACNVQTRDTQRQSYAHLRLRLKKPVVPFSVSVKQSILCDIASKNINVVTCLDYRHTDKVVYMLVCERLVQNDVPFCISIFFFPPFFQLCDILADT